MSWEREEKNIAVGHVKLLFVYYNKGKNKRWKTMNYCRVILLVLLPLLPYSSRAINFMRPKGEDVVFYHGLRNLDDLERFIASRAMTARETVYREAASPNRLVMGGETGA